MHDEDPTIYAFGTVLAGYLMAWAFWAVGGLWNRAVPQRPVNPWILPCIFFGLAYLGFYTGRAAPEPNDPVVALGILPAVLGCLRSAFLWRRPQAAEDFGVSHGD